MLDTSAAIKFYLPEDVDSGLITADNRLLRSLDGTDHIHLARPLSEVDALVG